MDWEYILCDVEERLKTLFLDEKTGHDYWHLYRVVQISKKIATAEKADIHKIILASWLHDLGDAKLNNGVEQVEMKVKNFLSPYTGDGLNGSIIKEIIEIIKTVSFKGGFNKKPMSMEAKIVQDADRLDAMGAIGIARAFTYGGGKGRPIYRPDEIIKNFENEMEYYKNDSHTVSHFYQKLLLLKNMLNTETAKKMGENRHAFMESFLAQFYNEWNG